MTGTFDQDRPARRARGRRGRPLDVVIVGLACRFPGARDVSEFWANVLAARDCTGDVPADRWDPSVFFDPFDPSNDRVYCKRGGYLDAPIEFDPARHGVMPVAVAGGEPEQFLVLDAARDALADAGMPDGVPDGRRVEVVIGRGNYFNRGNLTRLQHGRIVAQTLAILRALHPEWSADELEALRIDLKASLPPFEAGTVAGQLTNATAGRVADRLNLSGASYVVDAASASSLLAVDLGARALVERRADLAIVGGVYLAVDVDFSQVFWVLGALSRRGSARPFSATADGTLPGEGVGVVVLKRLADAERDGDRVYAVVKGVGLSSDGRGAGLAAPSARGHARAMRRAYRQSGIDPQTIGLVEGHGLGVPASDRAELRALCAVFPKPERGRRALGAVSSMIGHAMPAAGMAGLIKTALALHHRVIPPTLHADDPHPLLNGESSPFALVGASRPWVHGHVRQPRRAAVNAFGFAGVNTHAVLEEHASSADGETPGWMNRWDSEAILLGAPDREGCLGLARALLDWLETGSNATVPLRDLAYTLNNGQRTFPSRVGLVVSSTLELCDRLRMLIERLGDPNCRQIRDGRGIYYWDEPLSGPGRLAFLFPGEGSQYPGMLADLCPHFPELRRVLDTSDRIALEAGHNNLPSDLLFDKSGGEDSGLWSIGTAVNVVLSSQWALYQLLTRLGLRPDAVVGHSSGEFLALSAAGVFQTDRQIEDRLGELGTVFERLEAAGLVPGARLVAVAADHRVVEEACRSDGETDAILVIDNCPHQVVVAAPPDQADAVLALLRKRGLLCEELPFRRAYHTPAFAEALEPVRAFFQGIALQPPTRPIYSCSIAAKMPADVESVRSLAVSQWVRPVEFRSTVEAMYDDGVRLFVEVGARGNLAGYVEDTLRGRPHLAIAANLPRRSGLTQLNHLVAALAAQGVDLDLARLYARRRPKTVDLSSDIPPPRPVPALAVGFPELRLSEGLAARLRERIRQQTTKSDAETTDANGLPRRNNGHDPSHANGRHMTRDLGRERVNGRHHATSDRASTLHPDASFLPDVASESRISTQLEGPPGLVADEVMIDHLRTMDLFLENQRQVIEAYLGARSVPNYQPEVLAPARTADVTPSCREEGFPRSVEPAPLVTPGYESTNGDAQVDDVLSPTKAPAEPRLALLEQVSRRTGYPMEILDLGQDMEADLGIDSIKRVEIFGELQNLGLVSDGVELDRLSRCKTLGQVLELISAGPVSRPPVPSAPGPWSGAVLTFVPGREFAGTWTLDAATDPVAKHHTLGGRRLSDLDRGRLGLPVIPFTVMAEILAQAAAVLAPGRAVVALRQVVARRWVPYESQPTELEVRATRDLDRPDEVQVVLKPWSGQNEQSAGKEKGVAFEGIVVFGESRPAGPVPEDLALEPRACRFTAAELYDDQWLFHGPALKGLVRVGSSTPAGIEGTLRVLPRRDLLPERLWPKLHTDPIVLDAFTHLFGCWGIDKQAGEEGDVMFPLRVAEIALFGSDPPEGASVECRIAVRDVSRHRVLADAELQGPNGLVWVKITGWEDWRFFWPTTYRDVFRDPKRVLIGEPLEIDGGSGRLCAVWVEPPGDMTRAVWGDVLEWVQLGPDERLENRRRGETEPCLRLRILGKIAAKEAARRLWLVQGREPLYPADLAVEHDGDGRPVLRSLLEPERSDLPAVSIAHTEGVAVAVASLDPSARIGIDTEAVRSRGDVFEASAFLEREREWLDRNTKDPSERDEWVARFWCAKEAAAKATGLGMIDGPRGVEVIEANRATGNLVVRLGEVLASRCPELAREPLVCRSARRGDRVWAWTIAPRDEP